MPRPAKPRRRPDAGTAARDILTVPLDAGDRAALERVAWADATAAGMTRPDRSATIRRLIRAADRLVATTAAR